MAEKKFGRALSPAEIWKLSSNKIFAFRWIALDWNLFFYLPYFFSFPPCSQMPAPVCSYVYPVQSYLSQSAIVWEQMTNKRKQYDWIPEKKLDGTYVYMYMIIIEFYAAAAAAASPFFNIGGFFIRWTSQENPELRSYGSRIDFEQTIIIRKMGSDDSDRDYGSEKEFTRKNWAVNSL